MITDIARKLLDSFNGNQPCNNNLFMDCNQSVSAILDLICSNTKILGPEFGNFSREELRPIAKNFLMHKDTNLFHRLRTNSTETLQTDFLVDNAGFFHVVIPHLSFFSGPLQCYDENAAKKFEKKVLKPYAKQISKDKPLSQKFTQKLQKDIEKMLKSTNNNSNLNELYSNYIVDSILNNPNFIKKTIQSTENKPSSGKFFQKFNKSNAICQSLNQEFLSNTFNRGCIPDTFLSINELYYTSRTTLSALSVDLPSLTPEALEQHLISLNDSLLQQTGRQSVYYKPGQYREQPVLVGTKELVLNGDKGYVDGFDPQCTERISIAMKPLSSDIISLAQNATNMPLEEYIKQVALIHFRYINIHPFSNGNGRTGRLVTNMLLQEKNLLFNIESDEAKNEYLQVMNSVEHSVLEHMNPSDYLTNLYTNPNANKTAEEASISALSDFITAHSFTPDISGTNSKSLTQEKNLTAPYINSDPDLSHDL